MKTQWTPSGQPKMGTVLAARTIEGERFPVVVVGKLFGPKGIADVVGVIVEDRERGGRVALDWPIVSETTGEPVPREELEWADHE